MVSKIHLSPRMTESEIKEIVERETRAWNEQNLDQLMSIFHPDMVWPWPRTPQSHDPMDWIFEVGRFNYDRWKKGADPRKSIAIARFPNTTGNPNDVRKRIKLYSRVTYSREISIVIPTLKGLDMVNVFHRSVMYSTQQYTIHQRFDGTMISRRAVLD
jgi:hypothetical protein